MSWKVPASARRIGVKEGPNNREQFVRGEDGTLFTNYRPEYAARVWEKAPLVEEILEDPDIEVDADIRASHRPMAYELLVGGGASILNETELEHNYPKVARGATIVNHFGDSDDETNISVHKPVEDTRYLRMNRDGKYYGRDEGNIKRRVMEWRQRTIAVIESEMLRAQNDKNLWAGMTEEQKAKATTLGYKTRFGANPDPIELNLEDVVEEYADPEYDSTQRQRRAAAELSTWLERIDLADPEADQSPGRSARSSTSTAPGPSLPSEPARYASSNLRPASAASKVTGSRYISGDDRSFSQLHIRPQQRAPSSSIVTNSIPLQSFGSDVVSLAPQVILAPISDAVRAAIAAGSVNDDEGYQNWKSLIQACKVKKRVLQVTLHKNVAFKAKQITDRIRGGTVQEIQLFADARAALVVFFVPDQAAQSLAHHRWLRTAAQKDPNARTIYNGLQVEMDWYGGDSGVDAICPYQKRLAAKVLADHATRVIRVSNIPYGKSRDAVTAELQARLLSLQITHVRLGAPRSMPQLVANGKTAVVEFASVRDAMVAYDIFRDHRIFGYDDSSVEFGADPCADPYPARAYCRCYYCAVRMQERAESESVAECLYGLGGGGPVVGSEATPRSGAGVRRRGVAAGGGGGRVEEIGGEGGEDEDSLFFEETASVATSRGV